MHLVVLAVVRCGRQYGYNGNGGQWLDRAQEWSITWKDLLLVVLATAIWGPKWIDSSVKVECDNQGAVVAVVNSGYSKIPELMHLVRCLFFIRATYQFLLRVVYRPGKENVLADATSRSNLSLLFSQVPGAVKGEFQVPQELVEVLVDESPNWTSPSWSRQFASYLQQV